MNSTSTTNGMKPYMVIEGSTRSVEEFEQKVTKALESGYTLAGELVTSPATNEVKFFQPVLLLSDGEDEFEDEDEDEEYDEDE